MDIIKSSVDTSSKEYSNNSKAMEKLRLSLKISVQNANQTKLNSMIFAKNAF